MYNKVLNYVLQPRYVVNQVTAGDYDCPRKVLKFLTDLHASFRLLNLRNDFLRKKFDGMLFLHPPIFVGIVCKHISSFFTKYSRNAPIFPTLIKSACHKLIVRRGYSLACLFGGYICGLALEVAGW